MSEIIEKIDKSSRPEDKSDLAGDFSQGVEKVNPPAGGQKLKTILMVLFLIASGTGTGYFLSLKQKGSTAPSARDIEEEEITTGTTVGIADDKTFSDSAEGKLEEGGIGDEGSHHLIRPGGESQYVYLTSSIVDLDKFIGRQIKVWGETFASQKAGWLMDVGKVKVLE